MARRWRGFGAHQLEELPVGRELRDNGRWRTRTRAVWQRFAPWVTVLPASEMLVLQVRHAKLDVQHWCIDTAQ